MTDLVSLVGLQKREIIRLRKQNEELLMRVNLYKASVAVSEDKIKETKKKLEQIKEVYEELGHLPSISQLVTGVLTLSNEVLTILEE